jgi:hypothetical protein
LWCKQESERYCQRKRGVNNAVCNRDEHALMGGKKEEKNSLCSSKQIYTSMSSAAAGLVQ